MGRSERLAGAGILHAAKAACMGLERETGGVDFIVQDDNDARIARGVRGGDLDGAENMRGAVGPGPGRIAHGPRDHNRRRDIEHEVERKRGLFHAAGSLSDPGARDSAGRKIADFACLEKEGETMSRSNLVSQSS